MLTIVEKKTALSEELKSAGWQVQEEEEYILVYESGLPYLYIEVVADLEKPLQPEDQQFFTIVNGEQQNSFFAQTDGEKAKVYPFYAGYLTAYTDVDSIQAFLAIPAADLWRDDVYRRMPTVELFQEPDMTEAFILNGLISEITAPHWQCQFIELVNALHYESFIETGRQLPIKILEDNLLEFTTSKNASGGGYEGVHRKFLVQCPDGLVVPFILSIFATANLTNDPVYGNSIGRTQLNIAMLNKPNSAYNLQVNLDKFIEATTTNYTIWHSGIRSRFKKAYVLQTVAEQADFLMDGDRIHLGTFPINETISPESFSIFIENMITYSYCRHLADVKYRK